MSQSQTHPPSSTGGRLILYQQTHHERDGTPISLLPLIQNNTGLTHLYIAAIHLNDRPGDITLNDWKPDDERYRQLWDEVGAVQRAGVKVMGMLGGAAKGTYERLGRDVRLSLHYYFKARMKLTIDRIHSLKHSMGPSTRSSKLTSSTA
jgi:hypothetical protein